MSEEKPVFKITDRRLFNSDGTPREGVREEHADAATASAPGLGEDQQPGAAPFADGHSTTDFGDAHEINVPYASPSGTPDGAMRGTSQARVPGSGLEQTVDEEMNVAPESDPTPFINLVMFIASPAAAAMGMTQHPGMAGREIDLPLAKHCIDLLATLREKSEGRLSAQEKEILESLITELRMQFVSLSSARPAAGAPATPRGFTGKDITGGR